MKSLIVSQDLSWNFAFGFTVITCAVDTEFSTRIDQNVLMTKLLMPTILQSTQTEWVAWPSDKYYGWWVVSAALNTKSASLFPYVLPDVLLQHPWIPQTFPFMHVGSEMWWGQAPYQMERAAAYLENVAKGIFIRERPLPVGSILGSKFENIANVLYNSKVLYNSTYHCMNWIYPASFYYLFMFSIRFGTKNLASVLGLKTYHPFWD